MRLLADFASKIHAERSQAGVVQIPAFLGCTRRAETAGLRGLDFGGKGAWFKTRWLLSGSGVVAGTSRDQAGDEGAKQGFAASPSIVHELEEAKVEWQLILRDAPMWSQPGVQQRPEPFHGVDVHLAEVVAILVAGILAASMQTVLCR
jgi:hypothetical protein